MLGQASFLVLIVAIISPASQPIATAIEETFLQFLLVSAFSTLSLPFSLTENAYRSPLLGLGRSLRVRNPLISPASLRVDRFLRQSPSPTSRGANTSSHRPLSTLTQLNGTPSRACLLQTCRTRFELVSRQDRSAHCLDVADTFAPQPSSMANSSSRQRAQSARSSSASHVASLCVRLLFSFACADLFLP